MSGGVAGSIKTEAQRRGGERCLDCAVVPRKQHHRLIADERPLDPLAIHESRKTCTDPRSWRWPLDRTGNIVDPIDAGGDAVGQFERAVFNVDVANRRVAR